MSNLGVDHRIETNSGFQTPFPLSSVPIGWESRSRSHTLPRTTSKSMRVVRFLTAESSVVIAEATGSLLSSRLLMQPSWIGSNYEMRNYSATFIVASASSILALIWALIRIEFKNNGADNYSTDKSDIELVNSNNYEEEVEIDNNNKDEGKMTEVNIENNGSGNLSRRWKQTKEILNPKHVILSFRAVVAKREVPGIRLQIILLMFVHILVHLEKLGVTKILFNFTQRMFLWDFEMFSYVSVAGMIAKPICVLLAVPFLAKFFHLLDTEIAIVGVTSMILSTICTGAILSPAGYYLSVALNVLSGAVSISIRSKMSRIIDPKEATLIFSALTTIEVLCP